MPGKKTFKKKVTVKKSVKGKRKFKALTSRDKVRGPMSNFSAVIPYPRHWICKFHYVDTLTLTSSTAGVFGGEWKYGLNSLYDPYIPIGGHKPYGFNQLMVLYNKYIVRGCHVKITFTDPSNDGFVVGCLVQQANGVGSMSGIAPDVIKEQPYSWTYPLNNTGSQVKIFSQYFPVNAIEGLTKTQYECSLSQYTGTQSSNPSLVPFIVVAGASDTGNSGHTCKCRIELTYYADLFEPILQGQS